MKYFSSRLNSAQIIIESYAYPEPFHLHLKSFFRKHKKYGSKDRKAIAELCFRFWRARIICISDEPFIQLLISAALIGEVDVNQWNTLSDKQQLQLQLADDFNAFSLERKLDELAPLLSSEPMLFDNNLLSEAFKDINDTRLIAFRPSIWIRNIELTAEELDLHHFNKSNLVDNAYSTENFNASGTYEYQVQDLSSQYLCSLIHIQPNDKVWDCCCASGGKSLTLFNEEAEFYLSDIREGILRNARERFKLYQLYPKAFASIDLEKNPSTLHFGEELLEPGAFDKIIIDAPCSGSGTWFRNPEHFSNFSTSQLSIFTDRQKQILNNSIKFLKEGGSIFYLTCSVFTQENEEIVKYAKEKLGLKCVNHHSFKGYENHSDSMFMAEFTNSSQ